MTTSRSNPLNIGPIKDAGAAPLLKAPLKETSRDVETLNAEDSYQAPAFSDEALALEFAKQHAGDLRFVAAWNKWLAWNGRYWQFEETLRAWDFARQVCRAAAARCNKGKTASKLASATTVYAVERLARSDRRLAAVVEQWDADPWLLNTPDGVIDLQTGQASPNQAKDYQTKITAVGPAGTCPRFLAFLDRITGSDLELAAYLQRVLGYALTGLTREHALFFGYGTGANGKSVLLSTVSGILGEYHKTAPIETFTASNADRHPTDLAGLRGARLVLLCHDDPGLDRRDGKAWQHGQRMRVRASAIVSCLRIVAIEFSTCRSGRIGGASGFGTQG